MRYTFYMNHTLESHKLFPYIAWLLVIGFAIFTYALTVQVRGELADIPKGTERHEAKLNETGGGRY